MVVEKLVNCVFNVPTMMHKSQLLIKLLMLGYMFLTIVLLTVKIMWKLLMHKLH